MNIELIRLKETASTNDYLRSIATPSIDEMTVVAADHQTAGRGQGLAKVIVEETEDPAVQDAIDGCPVGVIEAE